MADGEAQCVDVVVPTFNAGAEVLARAVGSALGLVGRVVVVDDGSDPPAVAADDRRVEVIRQANAGVSAARNRGLDLAEAEFALMLDDDDELLCDGVVAMVALARRTGAAAVVAARCEVRGAGNGGGAVVERFRPVPAEWADGVLDRPGRVFRPIALFGGSGCLIHRRVYAEAGLRYDEDLTLGEDRDFLRRAGDIGPIAVSATPALRVHLKAFSGRSNLTSPEHDARRVRDHLVVLERHYDPADDRDWHEATRWLVNRVARTGVSGSVWRDLVTACRTHGWPIPAKARLRRLRHLCWGMA